MIKLKFKQFLWNESTSRTRNEVEEDQNLELGGIESMRLKNSDMMRYEFRDDRAAWDVRAPGAT